MIRFHYFPGEIPNTTDYFTELNTWGVIENGEIQQENNENGPSDIDFESYIEKLNSKLLSGVIDPVEVVEHTNHGRIQAVVPSTNQKETIFTGDEVKDLVKHGSLGSVEKHEVNKYFERGSEQNKQTIYKDYELNDAYQILVVHWRTDTEMHELGRISIPDRKVVSVTEKREKTFKEELEYLLSKAPNLNPVQILQLNSQTRLCGVISLYDNDELLLQPLDIKKDPQKIINEIR